jgi:hypothetical protein
MAWREWVPFPTLKSHTKRTIETLSVLGTFLIETGAGVGVYKLLTLLSESLFPEGSLNPIFGTTVTVKDVIGLVDSFVIISVLVSLALKIVIYFWEPDIKKLIQWWRNGTQVLAMVV